MTQEETPDKDKKGRFLPGNKLCPQVKVKPGEERRPHATIPFRDTKGRLFKAGEMQRHYDDFQRLRKVLNEALTDDELSGTIRELYKLCLPGAHGAGIQLAAIRELHDRFFGKPAAELRVQKNETTTVNHNFNQWPESDLKAMEAILAKHKEEIIIDVQPGSNAVTAQP